LPTPAETPAAEAPGDEVTAPMPKTASRNAIRASSFASAPVGPKSDGRLKRPASAVNPTRAKPGKAGGAKSSSGAAAKFDWGTVGDEANRTDRAAAPPPTRESTSDSHNNVLRQQSTNSKNRNFADAPGPDATTAAVAWPSTNRTGA
jgi:hypothetical protein